MLDKLEIYKAPYPDEITSGQDTKNDRKITRSELSTIRLEKKTYIVPIQRSENKEETMNYIPVSLTSVVAKL